MPSNSGENRPVVSRRSVIMLGGGVLVALSGCNTANQPQANTPSETQAGTNQEYNCPPYSVDGDSVVCNFSSSTDDSVVLKPEMRKVSRSSQGELEIILTNHTTQAIEFNPYSWTIRSKSSSGWKVHEPTVSGNGSMSLGPDKSASWTLSEVKESIGVSNSLETGTHAVEITIPEVTGDTGSVTCIALFKVA